MDRPDADVVSAHPTAGRRHRGFAGLLIGVLALVACSGDDADDATASLDDASPVSSTSAPSGASPDEITAEVPSSSAQPTTTPPSTPVPPESSLPTTTPSTTSAPPTTEPLGDPEGTDPLPPLADDVALPIVFVHGFAGSAQQYESQKMRFVANGYPAERIVAYEHDGAGLDIAAYTAGAIGAIDEALDEFGTDQVYLVGHSRGTAVADEVLADAAHAIKVAKYVAIDGRPCPEDGTVPCVAPTQELFPGQAHVEVATSPESFAVQYEFLVGAPPEVVDVVPQSAPVIVSGRAVNFPANTGRDGATLEVFAIDSATGRRLDDDPVAAFRLGPDGAFGEVELVTGAHYEYVLTAPDSATQHHVYLQPYVRSSDFVRLLSSPPDGTTRTNTNTGAGHSSLVVMRMREWYATDDADLDGDQRDVLTVSTNASSPADVLPEFVENGAIGLHLHDDAATPGETTLQPLPYFSEQPFQSGVDVAIPADPEGVGTITITNLPRGDATQPQTLNVPNWPSDTHAISLVFADYPVD